MRQPRRASSGWGGKVQGRGRARWDNVGTNQTFGPPSMMGPRNGRGECEGCLEAARATSGPWTAPRCKIRRVPEAYSEPEGVKQRRWFKLQHGPCTALVRTRSCPTCNVHMLHAAW